MSATQPLPFTSEETLTEIQRKWSQSGTLPACGLLRLSILRDLFHLLHAHKSRCLATGQKHEAKELKTWEARIEEMRTAASPEGELLEILNGTAPLKKRSHVLPQSLLAALPAEKLQRYDRVWENALAAQACTAGWKFWTLEAWVRVSEVESWNQRLGQDLWPEGLILFTDGLGFEEAPSAEPGQALWHGQWTILLDSRIGVPSELSFEFQSWPGHSGRTIQWKPLYTPPPHLKRD